METPFVGTSIHLLNMRELGLQGTHERHTDSARFWNAMRHTTNGVSLLRLWVMLDKENVNIKLPEAR